MKQEMPEAKVTAWDISDEALGIAQENAQVLGANVCFERQDILNIPPDSCLLTPDSCYDLIVSNPPYIQPKESDGMAKNVLDYEPHQALFTPDDQPIIFYQRIADFAWQNLSPGGALYFELNPLTAHEVSDYLHQLGFSEIEIRQDQFGKQRFLKATKI
jgi:release factor glutamine methyltransferase